MLNMHSFHILIIYKKPPSIPRANLLNKHFCISHRDQLVLLNEDIPKMYVESLKDGLSGRITIHSLWI